MKNLFKGFINILNHPNNKNLLLTLIKIVIWKINQIFFNVSAIINLNEKVRCICPTNSSYGSMVVYTGLPEYREMMWLQKFLKKDDIFIDVGANIGVFSLLAASIVGKKGKVFSFEPDNRPLKIIRENIRLNDFDQIVSVERKIVSNTNKELFYIKEKHSELSRIHFGKKKKFDNIVKISSVKLDTFCEIKKIDKINLLKVDVEGAEHLVLSGATKLLEKQVIKAIIFEHNPYNFINKNNLINYLKNKGYKTFQISEDLKLNQIKQLPNKIQNIVAIPTDYPHLS